MGTFLLSFFKKIRDSCSPVILYSQIHSFVPDDSLLSYLKKQK